MVKSAGQQHEFKALSLSSDLTQVQEKLATLDHFGMKEFFIIIPCILCLHIYVIITLLLCTTYLDVEKFEIFVHINIMQYLLEKVILLSFTHLII